MKFFNIVLIIVLIYILPFNSIAVKKNNTKDNLNSLILSELKFRLIGPAFTSGRIVDIAVNPKNPAEYYVAAAY